MDFLKAIGLRREKSPLTLRVGEIFRNQIGRIRSRKGDGFELIDFDGNTAAYREIQTTANRHKINKVSIQRDNIAHLCATLSRAGLHPRSVLCHGTRNAAEQKFFREQLPDAEIIGTEISDTATQFPMTVEWDFHEQKPEWVGRFDVVFSNSWDHTYDPDKLFPTWLTQVAPEGALVVEWSKVHGQRGATPVDPFRATLESLLELLTKHAGPDFSEPTILSDLPRKEFGEVHAILRRRAPRS